MEKQGILEEVSRLVDMLHDEGVRSYNDPRIQKILHSIRQSMQNIAHNENTTMQELMDLYRRMFWEKQKDNK